MRLTLYSDYAMRVLLYLGARPERQCAIGEIASAYGVSRNHLTKIVHDLGKAGYVATTRGRFGGNRHGRPAAEINVGEVVRHTEDGFGLAECGACLIAPACGLTTALDEALAAFMAVLDSYTLEDLLVRRGAMLGLFAQASAGSAATVSSIQPPPSTRVPS
jgi:Rrf2 family nitric oxide-sensitive transcriptional repressor